MAAIFLILLVVRGRAPGSRTVVEGIEVSVLAVVPEGQTFTTLKPWHSWARAVLPQRLQSLIPKSQSWAFAGKTDLVWVLLELRTTNRSSVVQLPWKGYRAVSERGAVTAWNETETSVSAATPGQSPVLVRALDAFPRRDRTLTLVFTGHDGKELGAVRLVNPVHKRYPEWTPRPLPQTVTNGDVVLTLNSVFTNLVERRYAMGYPFTLQFKPEYEVKTTNSAWQKARVRSSDFLDATGNKGFCLPRQETAWKIVAQLFVDQEAGLPDAEYFTVTNQQPATTGNAGHTLQDDLALGTNFLWKTTTRDGIHILASIASQSAAPTGSASGPVLTVVCDQDPALFACRLHCRSKGRDGQDLGPLRFGTSETAFGGSSSYEFGLDEATVGNMTSLEIVLNHGKTFEFFINPAEVKTNSAAK